MRLIVEPDDGWAPVLAALHQARTSIDVMIFRLDRPDVERALAAAVRRKVAVRALIAHTNSEGERSLRKLELRLLAAGVTVSRTADDLVRYHPKYLVVDGRRLLVLGFNFTRIDGESRSFGLDVRARHLVQEVAQLFESDVLRQPWKPSIDDVVVSPANARERLTAFIRSASRQLLIYDPRLSDPRMIRLLKEKVASGVDVRILGRVAKAGAGLPALKPGHRLHVRALVRDGRRAFVGSQSLRRLELDRRRELGLVVRDRSIVKRLAAIFEADWADSLAHAASKDVPAAVVESRAEQEALAAVAG
jgi:phosphatidylserine/phosphatidylglycerophosphate/cardiolipin synthase-like enzyme